VDKQITAVHAEPLRVGVNEAARIIGVSRSRLYQHIKAGSIRSMKDGGRTLLSMAELRRFVANAENTMVDSAG
jgi:excisionase family DNA binding protein